MGAPGHGREKCSPVPSCHDKADASDSQQSALLNCCLNPGDVSVRRPVAHAPAGRHRLQLQSRTPRLAFWGPGFLAPLVSRPGRLAPFYGAAGRRYFRDRTTHDTTEQFLESLRQNLVHNDDVARFAAMLPTERNGSQPPSR